ncbi:MAG TPA: hypothetical protein VHG08_17700 [Longimicrobium sp.]|nr:hypothetical protein [Longimicrobium sp.]
MRTPPSLPAIRALAYLTELAAREAGYLVHGVRGWATAREIETALKTWGTGDLMRVQAERGRAIRDDVRAPGEPKAVWAYRITRKGIEALAATVGAAPAGINDPRDANTEGVVLRDGVAVALDALRSAAAQPAVRQREWVDGEAGWWSSRELATLLEQQDEVAGRSPGRTFLSEDLRWLVQLGYAERRVIDGKTHVYRITERGLSLKRLEWHSPQGSP